jgi:hypothetical protein
MVGRRDWTEAARRPSQVSDNPQQYASRLVPNPVGNVTVARLKHLPGRSHPAYTVFDMLIRGKTLRAPMPVAFETKSSDTSCVGSPSLL